MSRQRILVDVGFPANLHERDRFPGHVYVWRILLADSMKQRAVAVGSALAA